MPSPKKEKETTTSQETKEIIEDINKKYREGIVTTLGESLKTTQLYPLEVLF